MYYKKYNKQKIFRCFLLMENYIEVGFTNGFNEKKYFKNRTFYQRIYKFQKIIFLKTRL